MKSIDPLNLTKKAAVVASISETPLENSKKAAAFGADILELRLDLAGIRTSELALEIIGKLKEETSLPLIVTNRTPAEGGQWEGSEEARIGLLKELLFSGRAGPDAIDIELSTEEKLRDELIKTAKEQGISVIVSYHDFTKTPSAAEMKKILENAFLTGADIAKLAVMPQSMQDVLTLLQVTLKAREAKKPICTISMGELGKHTRVIAPLYGSVLTYASVEKAAAPGQLRADRVKIAMEILGGDEPA